MAGLKQEFIDETTKELRFLHEAWHQVRRAILKAKSGEPISKEDEDAFLRAKSDGTKYHRVVKGKLTDGGTKIKKVEFAYDKMLEIFRSSISIAHLRSLPEADIQSLLTNWHSLNVQMSNVVGAYEFLGSGEVDLAKTVRKSQAKGKKKGKLGGMPWGKILGWVIPGTVGVLLALDQREMIDFIDFF